MATGDLGWKTISGTVRTSAGVPLAGATVTCSHSSYSSTPPKCSGTRTTAADGTYSFESVFLHDTDTITLRAAATGYESQSIQQSGYMAWANPAVNFALKPFSCAVTYNIPSDWGTGFTADVTITNTSAAVFNGWTLTWTFPGNQTITTLWSGTYTQSGAAVSVTNVSSNATIAANGGTVNFGFNANYSGTNAKPTGFKLNGVTCQ
jgi:cellulase/cellobiase CelA1